MEGPLSREVRENAARATAALRALMKSALDECGAPGPVRLDGEQTLPIAWNPAMTARQLAEEAMRLAAEYLSRDAAFRHGHVYCYSCGSAGCPHAQPPSPGAVFTGYEPTGKPRWDELFNELLNLGDTRTDLLFHPRHPAVLARLVGRRRLMSDQLRSFGRNSFTYRIWGQVIAGYFHVGDVRGAVTIQIVETRDHRLHLQVVAPVEVTDRIAGAEPDRDSSLHRMHDAIVHARTEVHGLSEVWRTHPAREQRREMQQKAFGILRHLANSIERKGRQKQRRTAHAEIRGREQRPVHKAREDLQAARPEDFFWDAVRETVVVLGRNNRLHAFSREGRHITSLFVKKDDVERRRRRKRYLPLAPEDIERIRHAALQTEIPDDKEQ